LRQPCFFLGFAHDCLLCCLAGIDGAGGDLDAGTLVLKEQQFDVVVAVSVDKGRYFL
jgi:hypothetical protein